MLRLLLALFLCALPASAADFAGTWSGSGVVREQTQTFYFIFLQNGATLNGSGGPDWGNQNIIQHGKITGDKLSFDIVPGDGTTTLHFELSVDGPGLKGSVQFKSKHETVSGTLRLNRVKH